MLHGLDLFSGIGGISLALAGIVRPIAYCENDRYAQAVLFSRMVDMSLPAAPIWDDVQTLQGHLLPDIDIIYGGFPCQDISEAGRRAGLDGKRSSLFFEVVRLTAELRPTFIFLENVPLIKEFVPRIRAEFEALDYDCRDGFLSAGEIGAKMRKNNRWWFLAKAQSVGRVQRSFDTKSGEAAVPRKVESSQAAGHNHKSNCGDWEARADKIYRDAYGLPFQLDRLRALGNSVVPQQTRIAFLTLLGRKQCLIK